MKLHFCFLNWSKWSPAINGYGGRIQVKVCKICHKQKTRDADYGSLVTANELNNAVDDLLSDAENT